MIHRRTIRPHAGQPITRWVQLRALTVAGGLLLAFAGLGYRAYGLQIRDGAHFSELARRQHLRELEVPAPRGQILDRHGRELAITVDVDSVFAVPGAVKDVAGTAATLARLLDQDLLALEAKLAARKHFVWIKRHLTDDQARAVRLADLPGIHFTPEPRRFYPGGALASTLLGFVNIDGDGLDGLELTMNDLLHGSTHRGKVVRDARGRVLLHEGLFEREPGDTVELTLDRSVQYIAEEALERAVLQHDATAGTAVILEVGTGAVLAVANRPTFDPHDASSAYRSKARNRALTDVFEIGSPMKLFTVGAALKQGTVTPETLIDTERGRYRVGRKIVRDSHHDEILTVAGVIKRSSNVGAVKIAQALGPEPLHALLKDFGFARETGIELPGERTGYLPPTKKWGQIGLATIAYGYGLSVTPLQVVAAVSAIGSGGVYYQPRIVQRVRASGDQGPGSGPSRYSQSPVGRRVLPARVAADLVQMMAAVFEKGRDGGTARKIDIPGYRAGGKTGTSHKVDPKTGKYSDDMYLSSFVGLAPIEDPRIAVVVVIDEPKAGQHYGAQVAAPVFGEIVGRTLRYLGVPPAPEEPESAAAAAPDVPKRRRSRRKRPTPSVSEPSPTPPQPSVIEGPRVPTFLGLGLGRALALAREEGIEIDVTGSGLVHHQVPAAGTPREPGKVQLMLEPRPIPSNESPARGVVPTKVRATP